MAQKLFHTYKAGLQSNDFCNWLLGVLEPGRYRGYDNLVHSGGTTFSLNHGTTGIIQTLENLSLSNATGIVFTKQGVVIQESEEITGLSIASNAANAFERIDVVYLDHQDVNIIGGQAATYSVVQGANGGPVIPSLPNANRQIVLGYITIAASAANLTGSTYTPAICPLPGGHSIIGSNFNPLLDSRYARLAAVNQFTKTQRFNKSLTNATLSSGKITLNDDGNTLLYNGSGTATEITSQSEGTFIFLYKTGGGILTLGLNQIPSSGGLRIRCPEFENNYGGSSISISDTETVGLIQRNNEWHIITPNYLWAIAATHEAEITLLQAHQTLVEGAWTYLSSVGGGAITISVTDASGNPLSSAGSSAYINYYKVGKTVHLNGAVLGLDTNTANPTSGFRAIRIGNLPWTFKNNNFGACKVQSFGAVQGTGKSVIGIAVSGSNFLTLEQPDTVYWDFKATDISGKFSMTGETL